VARWRGYACCSGVRAAAESRERRQAIGHTRPVATRQLDVVMARALAKRPEDRFGSAREFAAAAAGASTSLTVRSTSPTPRGAVTATPPFNQVRPNASERSGRPREPIRLHPALLARSGVRRPIVIVWAVAAAVALIATVLWARLIWPSSTPPESASPAPSTTATPSAAPTPAALVRLLPPGYPRGTCTPAPTASDTPAAVSCGPNTDPGGPSSATYTLYRDLAGLQSALTDTVNRSAPMVCPPNIQSPGPWRRNDSPTVPRGTLFCGVQAGQPVVAWTTDEKLLLSVVRAGAPGASLEGLYAWWGTHS
jgi:serine/threonine-protein kinase